MKTLKVIESAIKNERAATVLAQGDGDINRIAVCKNGLRGYINRSGAILCRSIEAQKIMDKKEEVSQAMRELFGDDFKGLYIARTDDLSNPARQDKRDAYYKH